MTTLVLGGSGQLGTAILRMVPKAIAPTREEFDLASTSAKQVAALVRDSSADAIINCAAYTKVDLAEDEEEKASVINGHTVGLMAKAAARLDVRFVTYSTDYVFDGRGGSSYVESSPTNPINAYGRSKLLGEQLAAEFNPEALVIRTSWLLSSTHHNFVRTVLDRTSGGMPMRVVDDQIGSPTFAGDLAGRSLDAISKGVSGILHLAGDGQTSWFDLARCTVELAHLDTDLVTSCSTEEYPTRAVRPAFSVLDSERVETLGIPRMPHWRTSLKVLVDELQSDG